MGGGRQPAHRSARLQLAIDGAIACEPRPDRLAAGDPHATCWICPRPRRPAAEAAGRKWPSNRWLWRLWWLGREHHKLATTLILMTGPPLVQTDLEPQISLASGPMTSHLHANEQQVARKAHPGREQVALAPSPAPAPASGTCRAAAAASRSAQQQVVASEGACRAAARETIFGPLESRSRVMERSRAGRRPSELKANKWLKG